MITIPNPCSENWSKMSKTEKCRFCNSCNKQVIDFSKMKNDKIEAYFESNQTDEICGNFKTSQIQNTYYQKFKFKFVGMLLVFISFLLSNCSHKLKGLVIQEYPEIGSIPNNSSNQTKGRPAYKKSIEKNKIITDTIIK